jgi:hypothetical protein
VTSANEDVDDLAYFVPQSEANAYFTIWKTSPFKYWKGNSTCKAIMKCIKNFREKFWQRPSQRVMLNIRQIYTDEEDEHYVCDKQILDGWLNSAKAALATSSLLADRTSIDDDGLKISDGRSNNNDDFFYMLISFDRDENLHNKALNIVKHCLRRCKFDQLKDELIVVPASIDGGGYGKDSHCKKRRKETIVMVMKENCSLASNMEEE